MKTRPPQEEYTIEHLIEGADGLLRAVKPEDLYIDNNRGVREAFKLIYEHRFSQNPFDITFFRGQGVK